MPERPLGGLTLLVIDDDLAQLEAVERTLAAAGARVLSAPSTESALRFVDTFAFDAVVYRGTPGPDVLASIRARKDGKRDLPAIPLHPSELPTIIGRVRAATTR